MTRLANPAAVARFADDNVATFPNGGGGGLCLANVKFVNATANEVFLDDIAYPVYYFDADNHAVDRDFSQNNTLAAEGELDAVIAAMVLKDDLKFFSYTLPAVITISDLVNAEIDAVDEETEMVKPINTAEASSFTVTYSGS